MQHNNNDERPASTHFGFREIPTNEKASLVKKVFESVAPKYDVMNDLMSFGLHRLWKRFTIEEAQLQPGQVVLDVASGTGDLAKLLAARVGKTGKVIMTDINEAMLAVGQDRLADAGIISQIECVQADAEKLPFADNEFDRITIAFGLRNVTDKMAALHSMYRVLKPGGKVLVLEFSQPKMPLLSKIYDLYSFHVIPKVGEMVAEDRESYQYLVESIRKHPRQDVLKNMMEEAGFEDVRYHNLSGGIVALHVGHKY